MFGIKKLTSEFHSLTAEIISMGHYVCDNTKELHHYADRGASILKLCQDTKADISSIKVKMADFENRLVHIEKRFLGHTEICNLALIEIEKEEKTRTMKINELLKGQENLFEYLKSVEKCLASVDLLLEKHLPIHPVPKLPKTKKATTSNT